MFKWLTRKSQSQQLRIVRYVLPLFLFLLASGFEVWEHFIREDEIFSFSFNTEVCIFGLVGPLAVFWVLDWIEGHQKRLETANAKIRRLNRTLEQRVSERTAELKQKNIALQEANAELQALDKMKSDFVSLVSHELRAPLTNINGGIELIARERDVFSPRKRDVLDILRRESDRLTRLVQNILDISLLEMGKFNPVPGPIAPQPFLRTLLTSQWHTGSAHKLTLDAPSDVGTAWADETHVADAVMNLINNAVKYSPPGSEICVSAQQQNNHIIISVSDQGVGIPKQAQKHVFDRFYRADNASDRETYGHGLGLYFCRKLIEAQNGKIWVQSSGVPGEGSTFYISLPAAQEVEDGIRDFTN